MEDTDFFPPRLATAIARAAIAPAVVNFTASPISISSDDSGDLANNQSNRASANRGINEVISIEDSDDEADNIRGTQRTNKYPGHTGPSLGTTVDGQQDSDMAPALPTSHQETNNAATNGEVLASILSPWSRHRRTAYAGTKEPMPGGQTDTTQANDTRQNRSYDTDRLSRPTSYPRTDRDNDVPNSYTATSSRASVVPDSLESGHDLSTLGDQSTPEQELPRAAVQDDDAPMNAAVAAPPTVAESQDDSSDLSSLGDTPPPPNTELRILAIQANEIGVEYKHTNWCGCPMHASYDSEQRLPHLSHRALDSITFPESYDRMVRDEGIEAQLRRQREKDAELHRRLKSTDDWSSWVIQSLSTISMRTQDEDLTRHAHLLVTEINERFPPKNAALALEKPVVEKIGGAIKLWLGHMDYDRLDRAFAYLVGRDQRLRYLFQPFLPRKLRRIAKTEKDDERWNELARQDSMREELEEGRRAL